MIQTLAISNYRSINQLVIPLTRLNLVTGANGSGKSNLYRALRLLADTAHGGLVAPLAREGGLSSAVWAGPEQLSKAMRRGDVPVQGTVRKHPIRLKLGFGGEDYGYAVTLGFSTSGGASAFALDPEFKTESIWTGPFLRKTGVLIQRDGAVLRRRAGREWETLTMHLPGYESLFSQLGKDPRSAEAFEIHAMLGNWRFYDYFRTDAQAPVRQPSLGTRTPVLHHDGHDLASALQTIREVGDGDALDDAVADAFPGAHVEIGIGEGSMFTLHFHQHGLLRPLTAAELSDGTLRYLLLVAALLTPRPPALMVLNEPESSLHPDLLPALGRLIAQASHRSQMWVVTHSTRLAAALRDDEECNSLVLEKELSETRVRDQLLADQPAWHWPE